MYSPRSNYRQPTTLGIDERWERVLCYAGLWVTGLIMFFVEQKNETVRRHARQSMVVFGGLSLLAWVVGVFGGLLSNIWVIGWLFGLGFGLFGWVIGLTIFALWIVLMVLAFVSPQTLFVGPRSSRML